MNTTTLSPADEAMAARMGQIMALGMQSALAQMGQPSGLAGMERRPPPPPKVFASTMVDVVNPSKRMRIIYPMATAEGVGIEPGQTLTKVRMALHVIEQLRKQGEDELKLDPLSQDRPLIITEHTSGEAAVAVVE